MWKLKEYEKCGISKWLDSSQLCIQPLFAYHANNHTVGDFQIPCLQVFEKIWLAQWTQVPEVAIVIVARRELSNERTVRGRYGKK